MIFIVRDEHERGRDERIAKHVMNIHMNGHAPNSLANAAEQQSAIPLDKMKRYISYCKAHCAPTLSEAASERLSSHFIALRSQLQSSETAAGARSSIPITVRQLEAIVRITESLAKLSLSPIATERHVDEAIRLFLASTMDAATSGENSQHAQAAGGGGNRELIAEVGKVEEELRRRLPIGWSTSLATLRREFVQGRGYSEAALGRALQVLGRRDTVQMRNGGALVHRSGV